MVDGIRQGPGAAERARAVAVVNPPPAPLSPWSGWLPLLILGLGVGTLVAGSVTLARKLIPRPASITMIAVGAAALGGYLLQGCCRTARRPQPLGYLPPPPQGGGYPHGIDPFRPRTTDEVFRELIFGAPPPVTMAKPAAGSGRMVTREIPVSAATGVTIHHDDATVEVVQGPTTKLEVTAEDNVIDLLQPSNNQATSEIYLQSKHKSVVAPTRKIVYRVTLPEVRAVNILAPRQFPGLSATPSTINIGSLQGDYRFVCTIQATSGTVTVKSGKVTSQYVSILGNGQYRAPNLVTQTSDVNLMEVGATAHIHATQHPTGQILGRNITVRYRGNPAVKIGNHLGGQLIPDSSPTTPS